MHAPAPIRFRTRYRSRSSVSGGEIGALEELRAYLRENDPGSLFIPALREYHLRMAWWDRWKRRGAEHDRPEAQQSALTHVRHTLGASMADADATDVRIATSVAGLLAAVAYADRCFSDDEERHLRLILCRIRGFDADAADTICRLLRDHAAELQSVHTYALTRDLKQWTDRSVRLEILDALIDLAAADGVIEGSESAYLRQLATAMGLTQEEYNTSQQRHLHKLGVLRP